MTPNELTQALTQRPVDFHTVISVIDTHYDFTPTAFQNGKLHNEAGQNNGSCKVFAFAKLHQLSIQATLNAFGDYYTQEVLQNPEGDNHGNIRNFMQTGWEGIQFEGEPLKEKIKE